MILLFTSRILCNTSYLLLQSLSSGHLGFSVSLELHVDCKLGAFVMLFCLLPFPPPGLLITVMNFYSYLRSNLEVFPQKNFPAPNSRSSYFIMEPVELHCLLSKLVSQLIHTLLSVSIICRLMTGKLKPRRSRIAIKISFIMLFQNLAQILLAPLMGNMQR